MSQQRKRNTYYKRLLETGGIPMAAASELRGRAAAKYSDLYQRSLDNAVEYARQDGFVVLEQPGPRGGRWQGKYILVQRKAA